MIWDNHFHKVPRKKHVKPARQVDQHKTSRFVIYLWQNRYISTIMLTQPLNAQACKSYHISLLTSLADYIPHKSLFRQSLMNKGEADGTEKLGRMIISIHYLKSYIHI